MNIRILAFVFVSLCVLSPAQGQDVPVQEEEPKSRQAILAKKRQEKSLQLQPY